MKVSRFIFNMFGVNCYVLWDPDTREAAIVDPGMADRAECDALDDFLTRNRLHATQLIDTHMHLDHIFGNLYVKERYGLPVRAAKADEFLGLTLNDQAARFRLPVKAEDHGIDMELKDGDVLHVGGEELRVLAVPGHSPGSIALYAPGSGFVITGDALFAGSIGRTDLPGGDFATLIGSIREKLMKLPPETVVLPGHGDETTIGRELKSNPYIR